MAIGVCTIGGVRLYDNVDNIENYRSTMFKGLGIDNTTDAVK